jgi:class 3 adenylate cyclase
MQDFTLDEVAVRAQVDPAEVERLVAVGLIEPDPSGRFTSGHVRRIRILRSLERSGLPVSEIAEAVRRGILGLDFADMPTYERFDPLGEGTFEQLAAETGVPVDLLLAIREAMGFAQAAAGDRVGQDEREVVPLVQWMLQHDFRQAVIDRTLRAYGESVRRVAETEADWWNTELQRPMLERGGSYGELVEFSTRVSGELSALTDRALLGMFHGQQANQWMRNILNGFEATLTAAGLHSALQQPPAICFLDLTGYTRITDERGDEAAAELAGHLARLVERTSREHGGKPVKWLGDGVMFHFPAAGPGVLAALEMVDGARTVGLPPAHVGLHAGAVLFQAGDYFGRTVNIAARIADYARQGEVLVSQEVVDAAGTDGVRAVSFDPIGPVELKGVGQPIRLYAARRPG